VKRRDLSPAEAARGAEQAAEHLARDRRVQLVYLFGSTVDPDRTAARDVDLAVLTEPALTLDELMRVRADLVALTAAPVDLLGLNDASIVLAHEVVESGRCLFARTPDAETEFVTRTRARYWDFKPYRDEQWRLAGQRLAERPVGP
jgi:predicted nucleotidyltransferase